MKDQPIELVSSEVGKKIFDEENQILADKDWLKNLKLDFKNISNKTITHIKIYLKIEAQGNMKYPLRIPVSFGQAPLPKSFKSSENSDVLEAKILKPNEVIKISIKPFFESALPFLKENEIEEVARVKIIFDFIVFDDGTAWSQGQKLRQNTDNDKQWDVVGASQRELENIAPNSLPNSTMRLINDLLEKSIAPYWSIKPNFFLQNSHSQKDLLY
jgi:hypothetical protein